MLPYDIEHLLYWLFSWTTAFRILLLLLELVLCACLWRTLVKRCARHPVTKRLAAGTVLAAACVCVVLFPLRLREDYAYTVLGGELFSDIPDAMRWLLAHGRESRLVRTVRAPSREDEPVWNNTRFFAALVLAKKNPEASRKILPPAPPFEGMCIDWESVFATNRTSSLGSWTWSRVGETDDGRPISKASYSVSGADILQWEWN